MYDYAGQPYKTQEMTREVLRRMYIGSEIGQGYAGDEDNGETSAWYLFSALGFYPLQVGSPHYAIGSPLFKKATIHQDSGRDIVIEAPDNSRSNVYVQGLKVNGKRHDKAYLEHEDLAKGARLTFDMGPEPSSWATAQERRAAVDHRGRRRPVAAARRDRRGRAGHGDRRPGRKRGRGRAVRRHVRHAHVARRPEPVGPVPPSRTARRRASTRSPRARPRAPTRAAGS